MTSAIGLDVCLCLYRATSFVLKRSFPWAVMKSRASAAPTFAKIGLLTIWGNAFQCSHAIGKGCPCTRHPPWLLSTARGCLPLVGSSRAAASLPSTDISHWFSHQPGKSMTLSFPSVWPWLSGGSYIHPFISSCVTSCEYGKNLLYLCHGCSVFRNPGESV